MNFLLMVNKINNEEKLTNKQREVLALVSRGYSNKQIAETLFVSLDTVKKHLYNSYKKLGAKNKIEALQKAGVI